MATTEQENLINPLNIDQETLIELIASKAADQAEEKIIKQEERRRAQWTFIYAIVGALGIGVLTSGTSLYIQNELTEATKTGEVAELIKKQVNDAFETKVKSINDKVDGVLLYQQLEEIATLLDQKTSFSNGQRTKTLNLLKSMKSSGSYKTNEQAIVSSLEKVIDSFTSASQIQAINEIDDLYRDMLITSSDASRNLTKHYGRQMLITIGEELENNKNRFKVYATAVKDDYPEYGKLYDMLYSYKNGGRKITPETNELVDSLKFLDKEQDKRSLLKMLTAYSSANNWQSGEPNAMGIEIESLVKSFYSTYQKKLNELGIILERPKD